MDWTFAYKVVIAFITSVGGFGVIVIFFSKWLSEVLANRLLENFKNDQAKELEDLKNQYTREIEEYRTKASLLISQFERFSSQQFSLYNQLWVALIGLKFAGDSLWEDASKENLYRYAEQIRTTHKAVQEGAIFLEECHYQRLTSILEVFRHYEVGKKRLVEIRRLDVRTIDRNEIHQIRMNAEDRGSYSDLLDEIRSDFIRQLRNPVTVESN
jgi:hypothetical protein